MELATENEAGRKKKKKFPGTVYAAAAVMYSGLSIWECDATPLYRPVGYSYANISPQLAHARPGRGRRDLFRETVGVEADFFLVAIKPPRNGRSTALNFRLSNPRVRLGPFNWDARIAHTQP